MRTCGSLGQVLFSQALSLSLDATSCFLIVFQSVTNQIVLCLCVNRRVFRYENVCGVVLILSPLSVPPAVLQALLFLFFLCVSPSHLPPSRSRASSQTQRSPHVFYRHDLINQLQHNHSLVTLVAENLSAYMETMRQFCKGTLRNPAFFVFFFPQVSHF